MVLLVDLEGVLVQKSRELLRSEAPRAGVEAVVVHGRVVGTLALMVSSMALTVASLVAHGCVHGRVVGTLALIVSSMARMVALLALMVASLVGHGCVLDGHGRDFGSHGAVSSWLRR